ncbi:MAG: SRPBCC family protein [Dehalococcoidia bacterium]
MSRILLAGAATAAAIPLYLKYGRPAVLNWGATEAEVHAALPGDDVLEKVAIQTTRAITVNTGPAQIWPWLLQMGPRPRAGVYTYDWIERLIGLDIENSDRILPEFQHLEAGDYIGLNEKQGLKVLEVQAERALVLQWEPAGSTWTFVLQAEGASTRLLSRNLIPGGGPGFWLGMVALMEPGSLVMERKMLLGIKERAEKLAAKTSVSP